MKFHFQLAPVVMVGMFLITACTKEKAKSVDPPVIKEAKIIRRDFTKGIMTITYTDGSTNVSKIPIDSSAFHPKKRNLAGARGSGEIVEEWNGGETEQLTPIYDPDALGFYDDNIYYGVGPKIKTTVRVFLESTDGIITGYRDASVEITSNKSVYFKWKSWQVTRTATIGGFIFYPGGIGTGVGICEWDYTVFFYYTFSFPYSPPQTTYRQYQDIKYVYPSP